MNRQSATPARYTAEAHALRRRRFFILSAGFVVAMTAGLLWLYLSVRVSRFGCVEKGVLYRSGQPGRGALRTMKAYYGIRSIVNLRQPDRVAEDPLAQEEVAFAREHGMAFYNLPVRDENFPELAERFLAIVAEPSNRPVLVHCAEGRERAGLMSALYRVAVSGWTPEEALREMREYGFRMEKYRQAQRFIEEYPSRAGESVRSASSGS
jgi:protein tyrosine/serine phosphatase